MPQFDFLVVGAGPFGATFARHLTDAGRRVLVIDRRPHLAGNCYDERRDGINVHCYGPHIFHTHDVEVWRFLNQFGAFLPYQHRVRANYRGDVYSVPFDLNLLHRFYGVSTPAEARRLLEGFKGSGGRAENLEQWAIEQVGPLIYERLVKGYTEKQWGKPCRELPASIIRRLPVRLAWDDRYFTDRYQGVPENGYTALYKAMLDGIPVELGQDYLTRRAFWDRQARHVVFTGPIDAFYDYQHGRLEYRSLRWEHERHDSDQVGCGQMNFTDRETPYTRVCEWKFFDDHRPAHTIVTREYPMLTEPGMEPAYPLRDQANMRRYQRYEKVAKQQGKFLFGGRLGTYRYFDMHHVIGQAMAMARRVLEENSDG